jgi:hypothetical protein
VKESLVGLTRQRRILGFSALAVSVLLVLGANSVGYSAANPYAFNGQVPPDKETYPPVITITSPINNTAYNTSRVSLTFNVTAPQSRTASFVTVQGVTYDPDWKKEPISVLHGGEKAPSFNLWLPNVSEGPHTIVIKAFGYGGYPDEKYSFLYKEFFISSQATICFTIDRTAPSVSVLPSENVSSTSEIPLNIVLNEDCPKIAYSLNGQQNVTVTGNSTLPNLDAGQYNVTCYVWDMAGNMGTSETANFTVAEMPNTPEEVNDSLILPAAAVMSMLVVFGVGVLLYKRHYSEKSLDR